MNQVIGVQSTINKSDLRMFFSLEVLTKKKVLVLRRTLQFFYGVQAKTFWVLIICNYKLLKPPKLQTNAEKSLAFISPTKTCGFFFFQGK